jgi:hypothetical protein
VTTLTGWTPLTARIERFERRHPGIRITAPFSARGKWEVSEPDSPAKAYDRGTDMMDDLEHRYPPRHPSRLP